jgi:hypothetical protein
MIMILPSALRDNSAGNLQFGFLLKIASRIIKDCFLKKRIND